MKGSLFQCFDAVWVHGRGAFKVASSSILETTLSKGTGDLSHGGPAMASEDLAGLLLKHETKSNNLNCFWPRSGQLVRFLNFLNTLPIIYKVIFISMAVKGKYNMILFICSWCLLVFGLLITVEPSECFLIESQLIFFPSGIFQTN